MSSSYLSFCQITRGIHTDCLLNYETVKYFVGEAYEGERYASAIRDYQDLEYRVICVSSTLLEDLSSNLSSYVNFLVSLNLLNLVQGLVIVSINRIRPANGCSPPFYFRLLDYLSEV